MSSSEWKKVKLGEVSKVLSGYAFKSKDFCESGIPVVKIKNITPPHINLDDAQYVSPNLAKEKSKYLLGYNDVLISMTGSNVNQFASAVGKVGRVKTHKPMLLNQRVGKFEIIDSDFYNLDFLYYLISTNEIHYKLAINASGAANQANISPSIIEDIELSYPPIREQKAIAATLSCLDDKIELNNKINKTLEEMAQAIFKSWFVDFEPFQDGEFEDSELGRIPKGWRVGNLEDNCQEIVRGFNSKYTEFGRIKNLNQKVNKGSYLDKQYYKYLREDIDIPNNKFARRYDILLNSLGQGTLGRVHLFTEFDENIVIDQHITIIRTGVNYLTPNYLYFLLASPIYQNKMEGLVTGSTGMLMLNISKVRTLNVLIPPIEILYEFEELIKPFMEKKAFLNSQSDSLMNIRDTLLPKLMSGEIRVPIEEV